MSSGKYDGLYVTHKPEDHDEWAKNRNRFKRRLDKNEDDKREENNQPQKALALSNSLKAALLTRCDLTAAQAEALIKEAREEADF